jgi:hypothetical protein
VENITLWANSEGLEALENTGREKYNFVGKF